MKFKIGFVLILVVLGGVSNLWAGGILTGSMTSANACGFGIGYLGGGVGLGDDATSVFGTLNYGFSDYSEGRLKLGFSDNDARDSDPQLLFGMDMKYQFMDYNSKSRKQPFDMAVGAFIEYISYDGWSYLQLGGLLIGSIPYRFDNGSRLIPYLSVNMRLDRLSNGGSHSDFEGGVNLGTKYEMSEDINLYGEVQIDDNTALFLGMEFRVF